MINFMLSAKELKKVKSIASDTNNSLSKLFDALGDINRFKIFNLLLETPDNICVTEFADILDISVPAASQQLKSLEMSGLIERVRDGQMICYKVRHDDPNVKSIIKTIKATT